MESFIERPTGPFPCRRLAVLVVDGSSSMLEPADAADWPGSKADAVAGTLADLLTLVHVSSGAAAVSLAGVTVTDRVIDHWGPVPAPEADPPGRAGTSFPPGVSGTSFPAGVSGTSTAGDDSGTSLAVGLVEAGRLIQRFLAGGPRELPASVTVLLLSDGRCGTPDETRAAAARLRADPRVTVACALFDGPGDGPRDGPARDLLTAVSSAPERVWSTSTHDRRSLPHFFHANLITATSPDTPARTSS